MDVAYPEWRVKLKDEQTELRVKGDPRSLSQRRHQNELPKRGGWEDLDKTWELMRSGENRLSQYVGSQSQANLQVM